MFQALAGGADCGPSNPLAQLSKAYGSDRGVQQDQFQRPGPSGAAFRRGGGSTTPQQQQGPDGSAAFFNPQHAQPPASSAFDLQGLRGALNPHGGVPAWATAFQSTEGGVPADMGVDEQGKFHAAFHGPQSREWSGEFGAQGITRGASPRGVERMDRAGAERYGGQGQMGLRMGGMGMGQMGNSMGMQMGRSAMMGYYPSEAHYQGQGQQEVQAVDWETAFLAQEASTQSQSPLLSTQQLHDDAMQESYIRPASPLQTDTAARDALARTAALLLTTVQSQPQSDKFANSTFLDLMRKLRDGEVAVEGDKVVEQIGAHNMGKGKGRAMDSGHDEAWAHDFLASGASTREEEGRTGAGMGAMGMGMQGLSTRDLMNGAGIGRISTARDHIREMARPEGSGHLWEEEDRVREGRESRARERKVQFQGDGGGMTEDAMEVEEDDFLPERSREQQRMDTSVPLASSYWEEDFDAASITGGHGVARPRTAIQMQMSAQEKEWETLQADWDNFEATATGISQVQDPASSSAQASASATSSAYLNATSSINAVPMSIGGYDFAMSNPYVLTQYSPPTRTHALHASPRSTYDTILEQEAAVQRNPRDPQKWLALGIKQQENEREEMAIKALQRALELDPGMGEAYLALAVSFTNENERARSYDSVDRWIDSLAVSRYTREIANYRDLFGPLPMSDGLKAKGDYLTNLLIVLAQSRAAKDLGDVDADVQIGLGVLFNTSEEYDKAGDCFESALSVRPDDPLLFNRLGATLANSGKTELAIQYYLEALSIQPTYVRARFNLAVASMNLSRYKEAIEHLLKALSIQEADSQLLQSAGGVPRANGPTSQTLWDSLNIALLMMQRNDLASFTAEKNLEAFRAEFGAAFY